MKVILTKVFNLNIHLSFRQSHPRPLGHWNSQVTINTVQYFE